MVPSAAKKMHRLPLGEIFVLEVVMRKVIYFSGHLQLQGGFFSRLACVLFAWAIFNIFSLLGPGLKVCGEEFFCPDFAWAQLPEEVLKKGPAISTPRANENLDEMRRTLRLKEKEVKKHGEELRALTEEERRLHAGLARLEDSIRNMSRNMEQRENKFAEIQAEEKRLHDEHAFLSQERAKLEEDLQTLLSALWPISLQKFDILTAGPLSWDEADRRFQWLSSIYKALYLSMSSRSKRIGQLAANMAGQESIRLLLNAETEKLNKGKDALLKEKLLYMRELNAIRRNMLNKDTQMQQILSTVEDLNYRITGLSTDKFSQAKGFLPWPVKGKVVRKFSARSGLPNAGLGISTPGGGVVRVIHVGRVVFNDLIRGLGRVVIISHPENYYSIYAYLDDSSLEVGQEVKRNEVIGKTGHYPPARGKGLYFELRLKEKAFNPEAWLTS